MVEIRFGVLFPTVGPTCGKMWKKNMAACLKIGNGGC